MRLALSRRLGRPTSGIMVSDALGVLVMIAALLLIALSAASAGQRSIEIRDDLGGNIDSYAAKYQAIAREGEDVRVGGTCASACTFVFIYVPRQQVCLEPDAKFAFHSVSTGRAGDGLADLASLEIFVSYPSWLQDEITSFSGAWQDTTSMLPPTRELLVIGRAFFIARGYRSCDQESVASLP